MSVPYTFATATGTLPLSQLDANFATAIVLGTTPVTLGDTFTSISGLTLSSPTLTTPVLGTPVSGDFSTGTFTWGSISANGVLRSTSATIASAATITPTAGTTNQYTVTALATGATIAAPSGTPIDGQRLIIRIKDNGTARSLTWTTTSGAYRAVGVTLPVTTVLGKVLYVGCIYNSQDNFWDVIATAQQA